MRTKPSRSESLLLHCLGSAIRERRQVLGLSQEELADKASLHRTYIGSVERGERNITLTGIKKIAAALQFSAAELVRRAESRRRRRS